MVENSYHEKITKFHRVIRECDALEQERMHYLLTDLNQMKIEQFPSKAELPIIMKNACGGVHNEHESGSVSKCYLYCLSKCKSSHFAPFLNLEKYLPGNFPVLDHVSTLLVNQLHSSGGNSYKPFLKNTIQLLNSNRQISGDVHPKLHTIIFGESSPAAVQEFLKSFNASIQNQQKNVEIIPYGLYQMDIECIQSSKEFPAIIKTVHKSKIQTINKADGSLPARIHMSILDERWEIVFPWKYDKINDTDYSGHYNLKLPKYTHDGFHKLFEKLNGVAIGLRIQEKIVLLEKFLDQNYTFMNCKGQIKIDHADLEVLLVLAGINEISIDLSILLWLFTGGMHQSQNPIKAGFGRWSDIYELPLHLNAYLQSKGNAVWCIGLICYLCILLTWFPTPGIAALVSNKDPEKFLVWFNQFILCILKYSSINIGKEMWIQRNSNPTELIQMIRYKGSNDPIFSADQLASMVPSWRNVTGGGCITDIQAIHHICQFISPLLSDSSIPANIRWVDSSVSAFVSMYMHSNIENKLHAGMFSCQGVNSYTDSIKSVRSVFNLKKIKHLNMKLSEALKIIVEKHTENDSLIKQFTHSQLLILYMWNFPYHVMDLYTHNKENKFLSVYDLETVRPVLSAFIGKVITDTPELVELRKQRHEAKATHRYSTYVTLSQDQNPGIKRKAVDQCKKIQKSQKTTEIKMLERVTSMLKDKLEKIREGEVDEMLSTPPRLQTTELELHVPQDLDAESIMKSDRF